MSKRLDRLLRCIELRTSFLIPLPDFPRAKAWSHVRASVEKRLLKAQRSDECRRRRKLLRRYAMQEVYEPGLTNAPLGLHGPSVA